MEPYGAIRTWLWSNRWLQCILLCGQWKNCLQCHKWSPYKGTGVVSTLVCSEVTCHQWLNADSFERALLFGRLVKCSTLGITLKDTVILFTSVFWCIGFVNITQTKFICLVAGIYVHVEQFPTTNGSAHSNFHHLLWTLENFRASINTQ